MTVDIDKTRMMCRNNPSYVGTHDLIRQALDELEKARVQLSAADDIVKAYRSEGVNNEVWVAIQFYESTRNPGPSGEEEMKA